VTPKRKAQIAVELLEDSVIEALLDQWPLLRNAELAKKLGISGHLATGVLWAMADKGLVYQPAGSRTGWDVCDD